MPEAARRVGRLWLVLILLLAGCQREQPIVPMPIRIGIGTHPGSALALIARQQRYFEQAGLHPSYETYVSGKRALDDGLLPGKVDVVTASDLPVAEAVHQGRPLAVIASIQIVSSINSIVARRDKQIASIADLKGHPVGTQQMSAVHYFLDRALEYHDLTSADIHPVYMKAEQLVGALESGAIDAFSMREPYVSEAVARMPGNIVVLAAPWVYPQLELVVADKAFLKHSPQALERVLRALMRAEAYVLDYPDQAAETLALAMRISKDGAVKILDKSINSVRMPQVLVPILERELDWVAKRIPDGHPAQLTDILRPELLYSLRPGSVSITFAHLAEEEGQ